jgi:hypothetical protein
MTGAGDLNNNCTDLCDRGHARWARSLALGLMVLASVASSRTFAADPKPDAAIKNSSVEASVYLDDSIKSDPALSADCLVEGRK